MSLPWLLVRGANANPTALKFTALMNKQNLSENELFKIDKKDPDILSKHSDDLVTVQDPFEFNQLRSANLKYYGPFEPDGVKLKFWGRFNTIDRFIHDHSFSKNYAYPVGKPCLTRGPDDGSKGGRIMVRLNTDSTVRDYWYVEDAVGIRVSGITTGFSIYTEFLLDKWELDNGEEPTILLKVDDATPNNGTMLRVGTNGQLKWFVRRAGTTRNFISADNKITTGRLIVVCLTYNASGDVMGMRIDNEVQTDSADQTPSFPAAHSLRMYWGIEAYQNSGKFQGIIADGRWYNDMIFSSTQMDNIWNNKRSISPIPYKQLAIAGHAKFNENVYASGFSGVGYDSTGYSTDDSESGFDSSGFEEDGFIV